MSPPDMPPYVSETFPVQSIAALTAEAERVIELLQERRTALIDVRVSMK